MPVSRTLIGLLLAVSAAPGASEARQDSARDWPPSPPGIAETRLPSGIRVVHLPELFPEAPADASPAAPLRVAFGFSTPPWHGPDRPPADEALEVWLDSGLPARTIRLLAYLGGGELEPIGLPERVGLRVVVPEALGNELFSLIADYLDQSPEDDELLTYASGLVETALAGRPAAFADEARRVVAVDLLGERSPAEPGTGGGSGADLVREAYRAIGTGAAWVVSSRPLRAEELAALGRVSPRPGSPLGDPESPASAGAGRDLDLGARRTGGVAVASRISGVFYEAWFNTLLVDRALGSVLGPAIRPTLPLSRSETVHLLEKAVAFPEYPEDIRREILAAVEALQSGPPAGLSLPEVKGAGLAYLGSRPVLEWFASGGLWGPLRDGWARVWNLTAEDFRSLARAYVLEPRATAVWLPSIEGPGVEVGRLGESPGEAGPGEPAPAPRAPGRIVLPEVGGLSVPPGEPITIERLDSGVSLAEGTAGVFVSGPFPGELPGAAPARGTNGTFWSLPDLDVGRLQPFLEDVRADRLLFFAPSGDIPRVRESLGTWTGSTTDAADGRGVGPVATADLGALVLLEVWLGRLIIEAGWWGLVEAGIAATEGSRITVTGDPERAAHVREWLASAPARFASDDSEAEFLALGPAAARLFDDLRRDLQVILWQRAPDGVVLPPDTVSFSRFRGALAVYY